MDEGSSSGNPQVLACGTAMGEPLPTAIGAFLPQVNQPLGEKKREVLSSSDLLPTGYVHAACCRHRAGKADGQLSSASAEAWETGMHPERLCILPLPDDLQSLISVMGSGDRGIHCFFPTGIAECMNDSSCRREI